MAIHTVLFDLDGTIVDSGLGVTNSVAYALRKFRKEVPERSQLNRFVGPPLTWSFQTYHGFTPEESLKAVEYYREYYNEKGLYEVEIYPGIPELLKDLQNQGYQVMVATSKPEAFAKRVLDYVELSQYFSFIGGASMDEKSRNSKAEVLRYVIRENHLEDQLSNAIMVGDREHDVLGAREVGLDTIGVLFGYGSREEFEKVNARFIAETPADIFRIIEGA